MDCKDAATAGEAEPVPEPEGALTRSKPAEASDQREAEVIQLHLGSLAYSLVRKLQMLPYDRQREVLDFVEFLASKVAPTRPGRSFIGALAHLNISCSEEDIAEARREMWGNFPREFPNE